MSRQRELASDKQTNARIAALVRNISALVGYFFSIQTAEQGVSSLLKLMNYAEDAAIVQPTV